MDMSTHTLSKQCYLNTKLMSSSTFHIVVCFPATELFNGSFNSTVQPSLQDWDDSMSGKSPSALLSSLCVTVGLVPITLVYCSWKYHRKIPGSKSMFPSNSQLSHADVAMDDLQPRKAAVHECWGSPIPPLWKPPLVAITSQEQYSRSVRLSHITASSQPPKYQLPPPYQKSMTTHDIHNDYLQYPQI